MSHLTRRSVLTGSAGLLAAGTLARPYIANAQAKTAVMWWAQGFVQEEDISIKKIVGDYEKASGNTIELSIMPFAPLRQKIVSAVTSGVVPDFFVSTPSEIIALYATRTAITASRKSAAFTACPIPRPCYRTMSGSR
jgi:multiple sugar transport system substrate-binding protein